MSSQAARSTTRTARVGIGLAILALALVGGCGTPDVAPVKDEPLQVVWSLEGTAPVTDVVYGLAGGSPVSQPTADLPWADTAPVPDDSAEYTVSVTTTTDDPVSCEIKVESNTLIRRTAAKAGTQLTCSAQGPGHKQLVAAPPTPAPPG